MKKGPITKVKEKLWQECRRIVFKKYGDTCFTCGAQNIEKQNKHCGHFITKSTCSTELAYDLKNLRPQCYRCNISLSGNWVMFEKNLIRDHGVEYVEELKERNMRTKGNKYGIFYLQQLLDEYKTYG